MKFFRLIFLIAFTATVLTGCDRQITSPIINTVEHQEIDTQFAQSALLDFADTATSQGFMNLADAVTEFVEALVTEDQTSIQPTFSKLDRFASEVTSLESSFADAGCSIDLRTFAEASVDTIRAHTIRDAAEMGRALQNLAQEAGTASTALQQLSVLNNPFRPFVFGYSQRFGGRVIACNRPLLGIIALRYEKFVGINETETAVIDFLTSKGYEARQTAVGPVIDRRDSYIDLGAQVNTVPLIEEFEEELGNIPNVMYVKPTIAFCEPEPTVVWLPSVNQLHTLITDSISDRYNKAWCQGNLDVNTVDSILIERSGLDFFNYAFLRNLVDIYVKEKPETTERIRSNMFSFRSIVFAFLEIYFGYLGKTPDELIKMYSQYPMQRDSFSSVFPYSKLEKKTLDEVLEIFRQAVKSGNVHIEADKAPRHYYYWHWK